MKNENESRACPAATSGDAPTDLQQLKELAEGVPAHIRRDGWFVGSRAFGQQHIYAGNKDGEGKQAVASVPVEKKYFGTLADFIAAANPAVVLDLIARIERAAAPAAPVAQDLAPAEPVIPAPREPKPSFFVITDNKGNAEYVTNLRHAAHEHINDACAEGVEGAGTWRAVPVFEMRPNDDHLWEQTLRDRDAYHDWADKLAEAISKYFDAYIGEHSNMNLPWAEALEAIETSHIARQAQPTDRDAVLEEAALACEAWGNAKVARWSKFAGDDENSRSMVDDAKARAWDALQCAAAIRALKGKSGSEGAASQEQQQPDPSRADEDWFFSPNDGD